jgi:hypothetical protein
VPPVSSLSTEDQKLVTLARASMARTRAAEGAAVRDLDGRTYAGASVGLPSLQVSAVGVAVAMAASSAAAGLEAVVVLGDSTSVEEGDLAVVRDFAGSGVPVLRADARGAITHTATT